MVNMSSVFEPAEPRKAKPLNSEEKQILQQVYDHWPQGRLNLTSKVLRKLAEDIQRAGFLKNFTVEQAMYKIKAVYKVRKKGKYSPLDWSVKHTGDITMRDRYGNTVLERACKEEKLDKIQKLLRSGVLGIVTDRAIALMYNHPEIQSQMIKIQLRERYLLSASAGSSQQPAPVSEECGEYSINQGEVGICYIVSVITLFRNEKSLINFLKKERRPKALREIISLLDADYSDVDFKTSCPALPRSMRVGTTGNDFGPEQLTKNGGSAYTLMMYIMNTVSILTDASIMEKFYVLKKNKSPTQAMMDSQRMFESQKQHAFAYVDIVCDTKLECSILDHIDLMASPHNMGFIFRIATASGNINHVIAGCFCGTDMHICNSWGGGCVERTEDVVRELTLDGSRPLKLCNICFFYSRMNDKN